MELEYLINQEEIKKCKECIRKALEFGANQIRISYTKSVSDTIHLLNGEVDKVEHNADRNIVFALFVDSKYGCFSTNKIDDMSQMEIFLKDAIQMTKMIAQDKARCLPDVNRTAKNAITGRELGLYDSYYEKIDNEHRLNYIIGLSKYEELCSQEKNCKIISEELSYIDSVYDYLLIDSNGAFCRENETTFEPSIVVTIEDKKGNKYSGYGWDSASHFANLKADNIVYDAFNKAKAQINKGKIKSGKYNIIVENEVASKLVNPIIGALNGFAIQQENSFLLDSINKQVFSPSLTILDKTNEYGKNGAKQFDTEGVEYTCKPLIEKGVVLRYNINTYISKKLNINPTNSDILRPQLVSYMDYANQEVSMKDILERVQNGLLITGFNGGNCNNTTGDFSYGVEGFIVEGGIVKKSVTGIVITGNFIDLWNKVIAIGSDYRYSMTKQIPSIAFADVDVSA